MNEQGLGALATVAVGALSFVTGRFLRSGRVATTDADRLWAEAAKLRSDLVSRIEALEASIAAKDGRIEHLERENMELRSRVAELERDLAHLRAADDELAARARL